MVGWDNGYHTVAVGTLGEAGSLGALPWVHLVRYGGCLAPHSSLRSAITPTPRQQGVDESEVSPGSPCWRWARLLKRVFAVDMARCPWRQRGALRIIAAMTRVMLDLSAPEYTQSHPRKVTKYFIFIDVHINSDYAYLPS